MQRIVIVRLNFFFFNDTATTEIYTLSLHDALPIWPALHAQTSAGAIVGVIRDSSGSVIPEAKVIVTNLGTNVSSPFVRSEEHTSELQSPCNLVCRLLLGTKRHIKMRPGDQTGTHTL